MAVASEPQIDPQKKAESPFKLVGWSLLVYGLIFAGVIVWMAVGGRPQRLAVNGIAAGLTVLSGLVFLAFSKRKKRAAS
jgi:hypothetical protein